MLRKATLALALVAAPVAAQDGNDDLAMREVVAQCEGESAFGETDVFSCWQYIDGVISSSSFTARMLQMDPIFCLPEIYSRRMLRESVLAWVSKNEAVIDLPAHVVILTAMERQYPCRQG
jgi:hypothetical protein